eukprot:gene1526-911_t
MSAVDKRLFAERVVGTTEAKDTVRVFAFTNRRPGYEVVFSPESPLLILKSKAPSKPQHPCLQWEPFSKVVHEAQPNTTSAVYVVDTSCLQGPEYTNLEEGANASIGPVMKKLRNTLCKLNPHNGLLIAAGAAAFLGLKYVLVGEKTLGHQDRLVRGVVLVLPGAAPSPAMQRLAAAAAQHKEKMAGTLEGSYPAPEVRVLVKSEAEASTWKAWLQALPQGLVESFRVAVFDDSAAAKRNPTTTFAATSLFHAVAALCDIASDGTSAPDASRRFPTAQLFRLDFFLSKQTKTVIQIPKRSPLTTLGYDEDEAEEEERESEWEEEKPPGPAHHHDHQNHSDSCEEEEEGEEMDWMVQGVQDLVHLKAPTRVIFEGRLLLGEDPDAVEGEEALSTTEGIVDVLGLRSLVQANAVLMPYIQRAARAAAATASATKKKKIRGGVAVRVATTIERDDDGRTKFRGLEVEKMTKGEEENSLTVPPATQPPPPYHVCRVRHHAGALVIRGRKCALVRTEEVPSDAAAPPPPLGCYFVFPSLSVSDPEANFLDTAVQAACAACECSSDNFYVPHYIPPSVMYRRAEESDEQVVLHVHLLVTSAGPPRGAASDAKDDDFSLSNGFEWVSFDQALRSLATSQEKELLRELQQHVQRAYDAGLYIPAKGCGVFGEPIPCGAAGARSSGVVSDSAPRVTQQVICVVCATKEDREALVPAMQSALLTRRPVLIGCGDASTFINDENGSDADDSPTTADGGAIPSDGEAPSLLYTSAAGLAKAIWRVEGPAALLVLGEEFESADIASFCAGPLQDLVDHYQASVSLYAVLGPRAGHRLLSLRSPQTALQGSEESRMDRQVVELDRWLDAVRMVDAVLLSEPFGERDTDTNAATAGLLHLCGLVQPGLRLLHDFTNPRPLVPPPAPPRSAAGTEGLLTLDMGSLLLRDHHRPLPTRRGISQLERPGSLEALYAPGKWQLLFVEATSSGDGSARTRLVLDGPSRCLMVEEMDGDDGCCGSASSPHKCQGGFTSLQLHLWCADAALHLEALEHIAAHLLLESSGEGASAVPCVPPPGLRSDDHTHCITTNKSNS